MEHSEQLHLEHIRSHNSAKMPVVGCLDCDKEVNRPIQRRYGLGGSTTVVPRPEKEEE